jgi:6-phosphogluconolactonase
MVANYGSGSVAAFPIQADGSLGERRGFRQHSGSGPNPNRQKGPHAHSIYVDPSNRFALAVDLGIDRVRIYRLTEDADLLENDPPEGALAGGAGPRHLAFHPEKDFVYVINELDSTVTAFAFDTGTGSLREAQTISTLPQGFSGTNWPAEVLAHPSGRFLYGSNRGHDSLVIYRIADNGLLELLGHEPTGGRNPRNFGIDPTGRFLFAAHQDSHDIVAFAIDPGTGLLTPTGETYSVNMAVCVRFR